MKFIINKKITIDIPTTKLFNLGSVVTDINNLLDASIISIDQNIIPILKINDSNYLINDWNSKNIKESVELLLTEDDLIPLSGNGSGDVDPRPYKVYTALLTQSETNAPVATVLENTLGEIVWSREIKGIYTGTLLNTFIEDKTHLILTNNTYSLECSGYPSYNSFDVKDTDSVRIVTTESPENIDGNLYNTPIEIRVYN